MSETLDLLLSLQQIDDEIDALRADEEEIPQLKEEAEAQVRELENMVKAHKQESLDLAKLRKDRETEMEATAQKKAKFQGQQFQVKTNREYEALQHEITSLASQVSSFEDQILEILDRSEKVSKAIADGEKALAAALEKVKQEHAELDRKGAELARVMAVKTDARTSLIAGLDSPLLARYERIRGVKNGLAVATIKNGACGGCFRRIPPQEMQILRRSDRIITCEGCGRLIMWKEETQ
jgi:predicted  nucleic acid-binding Zn-ribbon protein